MILSIMLRIVSIGIRAQDESFNRQRTGTVMRNPAISAVLNYTRMLFFLPDGI